MSRILTLSKVFAALPIATMLLSACTDSNGGVIAVKVVSESATTEQTMTLARLMDPELNTASEVYWDNAGFVDSYEGTTDLTPTTPEGWQAILDASDIIDQLSAMLQAPIYSQERPGWNQMAQSLTLATERGRKAVQNEDGEELFQAGAQLYQVCVACHQTFWSNNRFSHND